MTKHNFYIPQGRIRSYSQYKNCYSYHLVKAEFNLQMQQNSD